MTGNLFYFGISPSEIKDMSWRELIYWNKWVTDLNKELKETFNE